MAKTKNRAGSAPAQSQTAPSFHPREIAPPTGTYPMPAEDFRGKDDPGLYIVGLEGNCLEPEVYEGDKLVVSPATKPKAGDFVAIWFHNGSPIVKRLFAMPPWGLQQLSPDSDVQPLVLLEMLNPHRVVGVRVDKIKAIHTVVRIIKSADKSETQESAS